MSCGIPATVHLLSLLAVPSSRVHTRIAQLFMQEATALGRLCPSIVPCGCPLPALPFKI